MAWMPVAEAAAVMGVSERTVWRRIKASDIPSRSEQGRTLVAVDVPAGRDDAVRELSSVAAAQLSMRKIDADNIAEVLAVVTDYRASFDQEIHRARRTTRFAVSAVVVLLVGLAAGSWWSVRELRQHDQARATALQEQAGDHADELSVVQSQLAAALARDESQNEQFAILGRVLEGQASIANATEVASDVLDCRLEDQIELVDHRLGDVDDRLVQVTQVLAEQAWLVDARGSEITQLQETVADLREQLAYQEQRHQAVEQQHDRVTFAMRRSAAHSDGLAEGMRMHSGLQRDEILRLKGELTSAKSLLRQQQGDLLVPDPLEQRRNLLAAVMGPTAAGAAAPTPEAKQARSRWGVMAEQFIRAYLRLPPVRAGQPSDNEVARLP